MRDRVWILAGLGVFLAAITCPFWSRLALGGNRTEKLVLAVPVHEKNCVMPIDYMRSSHMKLLFEWRDDVVRENIHTFHAYDGKIYPISFTGTCMSCHNKAQFCDQCHSYAGVAQLSCWNCHVDPAQTASWERGNLARKDSR